MDVYFVLFKLPVFSNPGIHYGIHKIYDANFVTYFITQFLMLKICHVCLIAEYFPD